MRILLPPRRPLSRRAFAHLSSLVPLGLAWPGRSLSAPAGPRHRPNQPRDQVLPAREQVPDPETVTFAVHYPGKAPLNLVGHFWYNAAARERGATFPAIVEVLPYRCRDGTQAIDSRMYPWIAYNGYLCFRIDLQGSGDSEGVMTDEYTDEELLYCTQLIAQIARHPLCNGRVGMMGLSWGAINTLMVAARPDCPPALKAVVVASGTDDRFEDDVHYMGGAMMYDNASWPTFMWRWLALPPDPATVGAAWEGLWRQRLQQADFWFKTWAGHQTRDAYWRGTSVRGDYSQVKVPVMVTSGWQDAYKNQVARLVTGLTRAGTPARGMLGPGGHNYPFAADPGPQLDWLRHVVTHWWDPWLKDVVPPAAEPWPQLLAWLGESAEPVQTACDPEQGRWIAEDADWQLRSKERVLYIGADPGLGEQPKPGVYLVPEALVVDATMLCTGSLGICGEDDLPGDQRAADAQSLVFDSLPFAADTDCFGHPVLTLNLTCSTPQAVMAVRLSEISPSTGATRLISYRFFNLCTAVGDDAQPRLLIPGQVVRVRVELNMVGHTFKQGWRLRLALSSSLFPVLWPSRSLPTIHIHTGDGPTGAVSALTLPLRDARPEDAALPNQLGTAGSSSVDGNDYVPIVGIERQPDTSSRLEPLPKSDRPGSIVTKVQDFGRIQYGGPLADLWVDHTAEEQFQISHDDPSSMVATSQAVSMLHRPSMAWHIKVVTATKIWTEERPGGAAFFCYSATLTAYTVNANEEDALFESKTVAGEVPRIWV